jgi:exoribonuclease-2
MIHATVSRGPGFVVEFMQGNEPQLAWVLEESGRQLRLYTIHKRETKCRRSGYCRG